MRSEISLLIEEEEWQVMQKESGSESLVLEEEEGPRSESWVLEEEEGPD